MPAHAKRIKIRRKDLRQPDEFETLTGRVLDFASAYRLPVAVALATVVLVGLALLAFSTWRSSRDAAAASEFERAHEVFREEHWDEARRAFQAVSEDYPGAPAGRLARLYRAHALAREGDATAAAAAYAEYLASSPPTDLLRQAALVGLAREREATGDLSAALDSYTRAAEIDGPYRREARLGAARLDEAAGRTAEARAIWTELLQDDPDPDLKAFLATKLPPGTEPVTQGPGAQ